MDTKSLIVDANILLRAVFGANVLALLNDYADTIAFYTPDVCFEEAQKHIPAISLQKKVNPVAAFEFLERVKGLVEPVSLTLYEQNESAARRRITVRDVKDWPVLATTLLLNCPLWTEDQDFFGTGIATWTTNNIEVFFENS
jgi:predicted nucleic acid-binding protein